MNDHLISYNILFCCSDLNLVKDYIFGVSHFSADFRNVGNNYKSFHMDVKLNHQT